MSRYIDADALIETLNDYGVPYYADIDYFIERAPTIDQPSSEWIPCSERLPKDGQGVLVTVDDNEFDIKVGSCIYSDGVFFSALYDLDVIAWMPLPPAYEVKGADDDNGIIN